MDEGGALPSPALRGLVCRARAAMAVQGASPSTRIARAMVVSALSSMTSGELAAKGGINARQVLANRHAPVSRLHDDRGPSVVRLAPGGHADGPANGLGQEQGEAAG